MQNYNIAQLEIPTVMGQQFEKLPDDLFIPPNALELCLETFSGPMDLLLYLIRKENINILDLDVSKVTDQYLEYIELMDSLKFELAADYLVMAATLAEIKSRLMLPKESFDEEEDDPRASLIKRLQEYERYKEAAERIDQIPRIDRDIFAANAQLPEFSIDTPLVDVPLEDLAFALSEVMKRAEQSKAHLINFEELSTRERMSQILERMRTESFIEFTSLFHPKEGKIGVVVTFLAILELLKDSLIEIVQSEEFGPIHIKGIEEVH